MSDFDERPTAWVVRWKSSGSVYFTEDEANRAARNVRKYADYRDAIVFPVYAKKNALTTPD